MQKAQASTEQLLLIGGTVVIAAIIIVALLSYSPQTAAIAKKANCKIQEEKQKGLIGYWLPGGTDNQEVLIAWRLDGDAIDSSKNRNNGTPVNITYSDDSRNGKSAYFNGTSYIYNNNWQQLNPTIQGYTFSAWIKPTSTPPTDGYGMIISLNQPYLCYYYDGANGYSLMYMVQSIIPSQQRFAFSNRNLKLGQWNHVAYVYDATGMMKMYINGQLDAQIGPYTLPYQSNASFVVGNQRDFLLYPFVGHIDDVVYWKRPLSEKEIKSLAEC